LNDSTNEQVNQQTRSAEPPRPTSGEHFNLRKLFIGADGLRAGWGLLFFLALMAVLLRGETAFAKLFRLFPSQGAPGAEISFSLGFFAESLPFVTTVVVTWIMSKIEKRRAGVYGLGGQRTVPNFFAGLASGIACLSLLVFILWKAGFLALDGRLIFGTDVLRYGAMWLVGFLLVGLLEEYLNRGYLLFTLARGLAAIYRWLFKTQNSNALGFWTAALAISILFGLGHGSNPGESPIGLLSAALGGIVFCLSLWRTGSLWWAIGFHTSWDWAQSFLYGVPDSGLMVQHHFLATHPVGKPLWSGGTTGPEGSMFVVPVLAVVVCIIIFTLPRTNYWDLRT
jgi:membrane protease YdiL (CAAX protease family)